MEYFFFEIWRSEKRIALSEKKPPLTKENSLPRAQVLSFFSVINLIRALVRFSRIENSMNPFYRECFSEFLKYGLFWDFTVSIVLPVLFGATLYVILNHRDL